MTATKTSKRYFSYFGDDCWIYIVARDPATLKQPEHYGDITDVIDDHVNSEGQRQLDAGHRIRFTEHDQSWDELLSVTPNI